MEADRQKLIDRILKLLALAEGSSFEGEAANARRMADELLARHNVDIRAEGKQARDEYTFERYEPWGKTWMWEWIIASAVAELCGCCPFYRGKHPSADDPSAQYVGFTFAGQVANVEVCLYLLASVHRQRTNAWVKYRGEGGRDSFGKFCFAFARALESKIARITTAAIRAESDKAQAWFKAHHKVVEGESLTAGKGTSDAGAAAGTGASLHRGEVGGGGAQKRLGGPKR